MNNIQRLKKENNLETKSNMHWKRIYFKKLASNFLLMVSLTIVNSMSSFGLYDQNQTENNKKKSQASVKKTIKQQIYNKALLNKLNLVSRSSSI
jgi:uncharacterized protein YpmS